VQPLVLSRVQQEEHHKNNAKTDGGMHLFYLFTMNDEDLISSYNSCVAARLKCISKKDATTPDTVDDKFHG
jgi:arginine deiminase